jgi:deoxyribodipyrimidine photo-lyase
VSENSRVFGLKNGGGEGGAVVYWMSREQRVDSNFGLSLAQLKARKNGSKLFVIFALADGFLGAPIRHYSFMLEGLKQVEFKLKALNIPFVLTTGHPPKSVVDFANSVNAGTIVCDFDPLRIKRAWQDEICANFDGAIYEVDSHNIVPCRVASDKKEYGAYTIRPKIKRLLDAFLAQEADIQKHEQNDASDLVKNDFAAALKSVKCDMGVPAVGWLVSGEIAAKERLEEFVRTKLDGYASNRNDPNKDSVSNLSPYLHFGQIYAGDVAKAVMESKAPSADRESFLEELIVRKELSDNFCFYERSYDDVEGFPSWAKKSIALHDDDVREYLYSAQELESAKTHEDLWNAAQTELVLSGKLHGYMRMYWAKKILEWTPSAEHAIQTAIYLNDRYALDGRDPNGYAGIAWSIGGVHDRAWFNRAVFGNIRYMNANGAKSKFDTKAYIKRWLGHSLLAL